MYCPPNPVVLMNVKMQSSVSKDNSLPNIVPWKDTKSFSPLVLYISKYKNAQQEVSGAKSGD